MESINRQLKLRTNVISVFPSEDSLLRIVTVKTMDISDEWERINGKAYISPVHLQQTAEVLKAAYAKEHQKCSLCFGTCVTYVVVFFCYFCLACVPLSAHNY